MSAGVAGVILKGIDFIRRQRRDWKVTAARTVSKQPEGQSSTGLPVGECIGDDML